MILIRDVYKKIVSTYPLKSGCEDQIATQVYFNQQ